MHNYKFVVHQLLPNLVSDRRQRPKMTLSFGVDPSRKSLMFTTNSPFGLNDCVEVDPNLPLDRQEYDDDNFEIITDSIFPSTFQFLYVTSNSLYWYTRISTTFPLSSYEAGTTAPYPVGKLKRSCATKERGATWSARSTPRGRNTPSH